MKAPRKLPRFRRWMVYGGMLLALCVYYLHYGTAFEEGEIHGGTSMTLLARAAAVAVIFMALLPLRRFGGSSMLCAGLYLLSAAGLLLTATWHGGLNDTLFINTLLQLPILLALVGTHWQVDYARLLRWLCIVLSIQILVDTIIWQSGASLWLSRAFVGGVGNPSSFGMLNTISLAFCLFHPSAGPWRWVFALVLVFGAVMTKSLFAVLAVALLAIVWMMMGWRRALSGLIVSLLGALSVLNLLAGSGDDREIGFIAHKLSAAGALLGLVEYDVESSATVSLRVEMHQQTLAAIVASPQSLLWGHLDGLPYWPMDSQLLTYLGSFGALMLATFLTLHFVWIWRAWRLRHRDGGFTLVALLLFALIFSTNRVLDYFPIATLYFLIVAMVLQPAGLSLKKEPITDSSDGESGRLPCAVPRLVKT